MSKGPEQLFFQIKYSNTWQIPKNVLKVTNHYENAKKKKKKISLHPLEGFPCGSDGKESACNAGDPGLIPGLERFPGEGKGHPLMDSIDHGVAKSGTRLSHVHFHFHLLEWFDQKDKKSQVLVRMWRKWNICALLVEIQIVQPL